MTKLICDRKEVEKDKAYAELDRKCNEALHDLDMNPLVLDMRLEIKTLQGKVDRLHGEYSRLVLKEKKWVNYEQDPSILRSKVKRPESKKEKLKSSEIQLLQEIDGLRQDRAIVVSKVVPHVYSFQRGSFFKKSLDLEKMSGYRSSSIKEFDQADDDLATTSYPSIAEATANPYTSLDKLLSKKPKSLCTKPAPSNSKTFDGDRYELWYRLSSIILYWGALILSFLALCGSLGSVLNSRTSTKTSLASREKVIEASLLRESTFLYFFITGYRSLKSPLTLLATNWESTKMFKSLTFMPVVIRRPANRLTSIKPTLEPSEVDASSVYNLHMFFGSSSSFVVYLASFSLLSAQGVSARKSASIWPLT
ncbi:hypothetical protein Tco_0500378 [Tanacetum coccineum]